VAAHSNACAGFFGSVQETTAGIASICKDY